MKANSNSKIAGFTLVELMVSMVIAVLVMGMAMSIYSSMKKQYVKISDRNKLNSKQLIVKQIFYNAIGNSGFGSMYGDVYQIKIDETGDNLGDLFGKTDVLSMGKSPILNINALPEGMKLDKAACYDKVALDDNSGIKSPIHCIKPGTDYLLIQRASISSTLKTNSSNNIFKVNDFQKDVRADKDLRSNDYVVLCNAFECDLMKVIAVLGDFVSTTKRVEEKFKEDDYIGKYILEIFYVADTNRIDKSGDPVYSLYEYVRQNSGEEMSYELADNVSDLQIEYYAPGHESSSDDKVDDWVAAAKDIVSLKQIQSKALKISFKISGDEFSKIYLNDNA